MIEGYRFQSKTVTSDCHSRTRPEILPQESRYVEVFAVHNGRFDLLEPASRDGLELEVLLLRLDFPTTDRGMCPLLGVNIAIWICVSCGMCKIRLAR